MTSPNESNITELLRIHQDRKIRLASKAVTTVRPERVKFKNEQKSTDVCNNTTKDESGLISIQQHEEAPLLNSAIKFREQTVNLRFKKTSLKQKPTSKIITENFPTTEHRTNTTVEQLRSGEHHSYYNSAINATNNHAISVTSRSQKSMQFHQMHHKSFNFVQYENMKYSRADNSANRRSQSTAIKKLTGLKKREEGLKTHGPVSLNLLENSDTSMDKSHSGRRGRNIDNRVSIVEVGKGEKRRTVQFSQQVFIYGYKKGAAVHMSKPMRFLKRLFCC